MFVQCLLLKSSTSKCCPAACKMLRMASKVSLASSISPQNSQDSQRDGNFTATARSNQVSAVAILYFVEFAVVGQHGLQPTTNQCHLPMSVWQMSESQFTDHQQSTGLEKSLIGRYHEIPFPWFLIDSHGKRQGIVMDDGG